jgi:hypothetical protein
MIKNGFNTKGKVIIVPSKFAKKNIQYNSCIEYNLNRPFPKYITVTPHMEENWQNLELLKLKVYCEKNNIGIIGYGRTNQFPFLSIFSDKVILNTSCQNPTWYRGHFTSNKVVPLKFKNICDLKLALRITRNIKPEEVVDRFANWEIYIREESYNKFLEIKDVLPKNIIVCEIKSGVKLARNFIENKKTENVFGVDYSFQKELTQQTGVDNYMSIQLLSSLFLNWQYLCIGGSANLFCMMPIKTLFLCDQAIGGIWKYRILEGMYSRRYRQVPIIGPNLRVTSNSKKIATKLQQNWEKMMKAKEVLDKYSDPMIEQFQCPYKIYL